MKLSEMKLPKTFSFGKYKGRKFHDVARYDASYLVWAYEERDDHGDVPRAIYKQCLTVVSSGLRQCKDPEPSRVEVREEPNRITHFADGSGIRHCGGPCGDLYFDRNGNT